MQNKKIVTGLGALLVLPLIVRIWAGLWIAYKLTIGNMLDIFLVLLFMIGVSALIYVLLHHKEVNENDEYYS